MLPSYRCKTVIIWGRGLNKSELKYANNIHTNRSWNNLFMIGYFHYWHYRQLSIFAFIVLLEEISHQPDNRLSTGCNRCWGAKYCLIICRSHTFNPLCKSTSFFAKTTAILWISMITRSLWYSATRWFRSNQRGLLNLLFWMPKTVMGHVGRHKTLLNDVGPSTTK